ncbi:alpha/beta hydrolase [Halorarius litoreus]|uniref:alpha/beta hydrolase n=1 Tax=Halorarius litoreus TaxID=2962676 RepID=UPI0020CF9BFF|nr:alpha/beta hydrolase [Halorarius litoreus]
MRADEPHPEVQVVLEQIAALDALPLKQFGARGARDIFGQFTADADEPEVDRTHDLTVPGYVPEAGEQREAVPVRHYRPGGADEGPFPTVVFFHGGGFVIGDLDSHDVVCRHVCAKANVNVVAVDYRRAPENPFPAAVEDAYAAVTHVAENPEEFDADGQLAVMGDSAGGTLAAVVSLMARDRDDGEASGASRTSSDEQRESDGSPSIDRQVLVYPAVDAKRDYDSWEENSEGYFLVEEDILWFFDCYFGSDLHELNPYAFPMEAKRHGNLPPATVVTAGFDPLRDEGAAYARVLRDAGVDVTHRNYDDVIHGFISMLAPPVSIDRAHEAVDAIVADLRETFE